MWHCSQDSISTDTVLHPATSRWRSAIRPCHEEVGINFPRGKERSITNELRCLRPSCKGPIPSHPITPNLIPSPSPFLRRRRRPRPRPSRRPPLLHTLAPAAYVARTAHPLLAGNHQCLAVMNWICSNLGGPYPFGVGGGVPMLGNGESGDFPTTYNK